MSRASELRAVALLIKTPAVPVVRIDPSGIYSVASSRGGPTRYVVDLSRDPPSCTCPRWRYLAHMDEEVPPAPCKYVEATRLAIKARQGLGVPLPPG